MTTQGSPPEWERYDAKTRFIRFAVLLLSLVVLAISWRALNVRYDYVLTAPRELRDISRRMYPPDVAYSGEILRPLIETVNISILGTALALAIAMPVAYLGATNTTPNDFTYGLGKFIISFTRSVNVIIWALIFVVTFGPGAMAGIFAVAMRSVGFIAKLMAEEIEEIDPTQVQGIEATGATDLQQVIYGIIPQIKPTFIGVATYRWDINVREATVIGFVGAGGIGTNLTTSIDLFQWNRVLTILIAIFALVIISELVSAYARKKVS
ncbi:phosphonate ABC transporter, permease protein PhnE [Natrialbaceae archaeon A-CW3]